MRGDVCTGNLLDAADKTSDIHGDGKFGGQKYKLPSVAEKKKENH